MATLQSRVIEAILDSRLVAARQRANDLSARLRRRAPTLTLYYQAGDAYSHLCAQLLPRLRERLDLRLCVVIVPRVIDASNAAPELWPAYAIADAQRIAPAWGLRFEPGAVPAGDTTRELAERVLLATSSLQAFINIEAEVAAALWRDDAQALRQRPMIDGTQAQSKLEANDQQLRRRGHYQGGMWYFRGDWYWALDRLSYLETRLRRLGLVRGSGPLARLDPSAARLPELAGSPPLSFFYSFRSPYSHIAAERSGVLAERHRVKLDIRPVLPMVMRGLQVPRSKRLYIARDAKREANRHGVPFGRIADPLGGGVERCLAVFPEAQAAGRGLDFIQEAGRAVWNRGEYIGRDKVLRKVLRRAGLDPDLALRAPANSQDFEYAQTNRETLAGLGLWGVPSYWLGDLAVWGQDRLWLIEEALRRMQADPVASVRPSAAAATRVHGEV